MKIYNIENNQEKVYVLKESLEEIKKIYINIPPFIMESLDKETSSDYIEFTDKEAINYFKTIFLANRF